MLCLASSAASAVQQELELRLLRGFVLCVFSSVSSVNRDYYKSLLLAGLWLCPFCGKPFKRLGIHIAKKHREELWSIAERVSELCREHL